jgi:hypothetical protein
MLNTGGDEIERIEISQDSQVRAGLMKDHMARGDRTICVDFAPAGLNFNEVLRGAA